MAVNHQELLCQAPLDHSGNHLHDQPGLILPESIRAPGELLEYTLDPHLPRLCNMGTKSW